MTQTYFMISKKINNLSKHYIAYNYSKKLGGYKFKTNSLTFIQNINFIIERKFQMIIRLFCLFVFSIFFGFNGCLIIYLRCLIIYFIVIKAFLFKMFQLSIWRILLGWYNSYNLNNLNNAFLVYLYNEWSWWVTNNRHLWECQL